MKFMLRDMKKLQDLGGGFGFFNHSVRRPDSHLDQPGVDYDAYDIARLVDESFLSAAEGLDLDMAELGSYGDSKSARFDSDELTDLLNDSVKQKVTKPILRKTVTQFFIKHMQKFIDENAEDQDYLENLTKWYEKLGLEPRI